MATSKTELQTKKTNEELLALLPEITTSTLVIQQTPNRDGFILPNCTIVPNTLSIVILDIIYYNAYYTNAYDPNNLTPPVCVALNRKEVELKPVDDSLTPQNETCIGCQWNTFKSAANKKAKACRNKIVLAVMEPDNPKAPIYLLMITPSAIKEFKLILKQLLIQKQHPIKKIFTFAQSPLVVYNKLVADSNLTSNNLFQQYKERLSETAAVFKTLLG